MTLIVAPVVEGDTEVVCVPRLIERVWVEVLGRDDYPLVCRPVRGKLNQMLDAASDTLARKIKEALGEVEDARERYPDAGFLVLVMVDADKAHLASGRDMDVRSRAKAVRPDLAEHIDCVVPVLMFENWFVAAAESVRASLRAPDLAPPDDPEGPNGKGWLNDAVVRESKGTRHYAEKEDGAKCVAVMDLALAHQRSASFRRFCDALARHAPPVGVPTLPPTPPPA